MSRFTKSGDGQGSSLFLELIAIPFLLWNESRKWLIKKVYDGWRGIVAGVIGALVSLGAAITGAHYIHWVQHYNLFLGIVGGGLLGINVFTHIWPALYYAVIHPIWRLADAIYDGVRSFTKEHWGPITSGLLKVVRTICVGSGRAWDPVLEQGEKSWFIKVLGAISYVSILGGSFLLAWHTFGAITAALSAFSVIGFVLGVAAAAFILFALTGIGWQLLEYGKVPFMALAGGGLALWGLSAHIAALGFGLYGTIAAYVVAFLVFVGYVFPVANLVLTNGFWTWLWKKIRPLADEAYDERDKDYALFFHHLTNLVVAGIVGYFVHVVCTAAALPVVAVWSAVGVLAACSYVLVFKLLNEGAGNFVTGLAVSVLGAYKVGSLYAASGFVYGTVGAVVAGVVTLLATGLVLWPLVYVGGRWVFRTLRVSLIGKPLAALYDAFNAQFKHVLEFLRETNKDTYNDKTGYREMVVHIANIAVAALVGWSIWHFVVGVHLGMFWGVTVLAVASALSYLLIGKLFLKSGYGLEFVSFVLGTGVAIYCGALVLAVSATTGMKVLAVVAGLFSLSAFCYVIFPIAFLFAMTLTGWALVGWLKPLLSTVYDALWAVFARTVWKPFLIGYNALKALLAPLVARFAKAYRALQNAYDRLLKLLGRH